MNQEPGSSSAKNMLLGMIPIYWVCVARAAIKLLTDAETPYEMRAS
jgi:hypothetical protein